MDFIKSSYYRAFVKFGRYCVDINAINVNRFVEYVIKQNKKLDYWTSDSLYTDYLYTLLLTESPVDALTRAIKYSIRWSNTNNANSNDMLRHGNVNAICYAITNGHIASWVLYNCDSGVRFLELLNTEQTELIWNFINPEIWSQKIKDHKKDVVYINQILKQAGW
jgi:hypothetical protein